MVTGQPCRYCQAWQAVALSFGGAIDDGISWLRLGIRIFTSILISSVFLSTSKLRDSKTCFLQQIQPRPVRDADGTGIGHACAVGSAGLSGVARIGAALTGILARPAPPAEEGSGYVLAAAVRLR